MNQCRECRRSSDLSMIISWDKSWIKTPYCRGCAFDIFKGIEVLEIGTKITIKNHTYIIDDIYTDTTKFEPKELML